MNENGFVEEIVKRSTRDPIITGILEEVEYLTGSSKRLFTSRNSIGYFCFYSYSFLGFNLL